MKIGFTTLFDYNYGSTLQAFATKRFLTIYGHEPELIIQKNKSKIALRVSLLLFCLKHPLHFKQIINFLRMQTSKNLVISNNSEGEIKKFIAQNLSPVMFDKSIEKEFDYFFTGSDQVWNGHQVLNDFRFLRFTKVNKRIAWAPSFGSNDIAEYNKRRYKKYISQFNKLSIRENSGKQVINSLLPNASVKVLYDPVILLSKDQWCKEVGISEKNKKDKSIFLFFLNEPSSKALDYIKALKAKHSEYKFFTVGYRHKLLDELSVENIDGGPSLFLESIFDSSFVITDSFHATIFSLIGHTPFLTFERKYGHSQNQSIRIIDLLTECSLIERFDNDNLHNWQEIDYSKFDETIIGKRESFIEYIKDLK